MNPTPERTEKTPRTDAALMPLSSKLVGMEVARADFARQLETELNQALAQNEALRGALKEARDRLEFYVECIPMSAESYKQTLEGRISHEVIARSDTLLTSTPPAKA